MLHTTVLRENTHKYNKWDRIPGVYTAHKQLLGKPLAVTHILPQWERLGQKQNFALSYCFPAKLISFLTAITQCAELRELSPEIPRVLDAIKSRCGICPWRLAYLSHSYQIAPENGLKFIMSCFHQRFAGYIYTWIQKAQQMEYTSHFKNDQQLCIILIPLNTVLWPVTHSVSLD